MVHGTPDWGLKKKSTTYALDDMAELAARLGSIVTFDRRGDVILLNDFEKSAYNWAPSTGGGASIALSTTTAKSEAQSLKLTTGAASGSFASISRAVGPQVLSKFGTEFALFTDDNNNHRFLLNQQIYTGSFLYFYRVAYDFSNNTWYYRNSSGALAALSPSISLTRGATYLHQVKLVTDQVNEKYARLLVDSQTYNLSAYSVEKSANTLSPAVLITAKFENLDATAGTIYLDDFIFTQNEP